MEFSKKEIHTNTLEHTRYSQLTIDDDFNIPDAKGDVERIIAKDGHIIMEDVIAEDGKVRVIGTVCFKAMYKTGKEQPDIEVYTGEIPFEDHVNIDGVTRGSQVECECHLDDITVSTINSRKLEVRGLIGNSISVYSDRVINPTTNLENGQGIECQYNNISRQELCIAKHDVLKLKEDVDIPQAKPNIRELLWWSVEAQGLECKAGDDVLQVRGELSIFTIYRGEDEHMPIQYMMSIRAFSREIPCQGAKENMVLVLDCGTGKKEVSIKADADGEDRVIAVDAAIDMNIKMYQQSELKIISDMYSPQIELEPVREHFSYENLVLRNLAKAKVNYRKQISEGEQKFLQVCHIFGGVDVDDTKIEEDGVNVSGVIKCNLLYISASDDPMNCTEFDVPFEYKVETMKCKKGCSIRIVPCIDQLTATLLSSEEVEVKAQVNLSISVFEKAECDIISDVNVMPIDYVKKSKAPGIVGYVVKEGDSIWSVARKYYATTESIRKINGLDKDQLVPGEKLIVVKS